MRKNLLLSLFAVTITLNCYGDNKDTDGTDNRLSVNTVVIANPYSNVNWDKALQIRSTTHIHIINQAGMDRAAKLGYRHLPVSNYYPSTPYYPIESIRDGQFRVKQDWGVVKIKNGETQYIEGPIYWNDVIMDEKTGWYDELPEERKKDLPFEIGDYIFKNIPDNTIFSPNAEHHSFAGIKGTVHINSPGSLFSSGTFDIHNEFKSFWGGANISYGAGLTWQETFKKMFDQLLFEDGGGVTINHPTWTNSHDGGEAGNLPQSLIEEMLDFDERVLGIEVLNHGDWSLDMWDRILKTGRKCLGFWVPDWAVHNNEPLGGFNILLVDEFTQHKCLKAYRDGAFFGSQFGGEDLIFNRISLENDQLIIELNSRANITVITDKGTTKIDNARHTIFKIPYDVYGTPTIKYVRLEAEDGEDRIFSQPIRFINEKVAQ